MALAAGAAVAGGGGKGGGGGGKGGHHGPVVTPGKHHHHHGAGGFVFGTPFVGGVFVGSRCWYQRQTVWDPFLHAYVVRTVKVCG